MSRRPSAMPQPPLRVAVIGLGIGRQHILAYAKLPDKFKVAAFCARDGAAAQAIATEFGAAHALTRIEDALALDDVDVVDICTPPALHAPQALAALRAGRHVICEKPLAASLAEIDALATAERASGKRLMPIFQYRSGGGLQKLKHLVDSGLAGTPYTASVEIHWRRRQAYYDVPWRGNPATEFGGVLTSQAIHAIDALTYAFGSVQRVAAFVATRVNSIQVEDCAAVSMLMSSGATATINATLGSAAEITRHRFVFDNLVAESNTRPYSNSGDPWTFSADPPEHAVAIDAALATLEHTGVSAPEIAPAPGDGHTLKGYAPPAGFDAQLDAFHTALATGGELPVTIADARAAIELLTAIYHSAQTGRAVELPLGIDHPAYNGWNR
jgi:predicted dehydrogenase